MKIRILHRNYGRPAWSIKRPAYQWLFIHLGMWVVMIFHHHAVRVKLRITHKYYPLDKPYWNMWARNGILVVNLGKHIYTVAWR